MPNVDGNLSLRAHPTSAPSIPTLSIRTSAIEGHCVAVEIDLPLHAKTPNTEMQYWNSAVLIIRSILCDLIARSLERPYVDT